MPIKWKSKVILAKIETAYATDPTLTGAANALKLVNVQLSPMEGQDVDHEEELPYLGNSPSTPSGLMARLRASVNLAPSGSPGVAPAWGVLLRALGCLETIVATTSVTYTPLSDNHESLYFKMWIGGTLYAFKGARGDGTIRYTAQGLPRLDIDIQGLFIKPVEAARAVPTLTAWKRAQIVSAAFTPVFTIGGVALTMRETTLAFGNQVESRLLVPTEQVLIVDRKETLNTRVEAVGVDVFDPYAKALDDTLTSAVVLTHGVGAGKIQTLNVPAAQMKRPTGLENQQNIKEWPLAMNPLPTSGNDQWSLALT